MFLHGWTVMFGEIIPIVVLSFVPEDAQDVSYGLFFQPVITHGPRLAVFDLHGRVDKGITGTVVGFDSDHEFWMFDRLERTSDVNGSLRIVNKTTALCLSC